MPLVKPVLQAQLDKAFADALKRMFQIAQDGGTSATQAQAITAAAAIFGNEASTAIDAYIKSATVIVPPGQVVVAGAPPGPGATTAPSPPAIIS
jgi:hypothetical protein